MLFSHNHSQSPYYKGNSVPTAFPKNKFLLTVSSAVLCGLLLAPLNVFASALNLSQDDNGWTQFSAASNTRIIYVSDTSGNDSTGVVYSKSSTEVGSDPFSPSGSIKPFKTYAAAYKQTRDGYPDWILLKRGDTFNETIDTQVRSGQDNSNPFLISSYGSSNETDNPVFKVGNSKGIYKVNGFEWIAISGITMYADGRDPDGGNYQGTSGESGINFACNNGFSGQGVLIEGCIFRFFTGNQVGPFTSTTGVVKDVDLRRNLFLDNYSAGTGHTQGFWSWGAENILFEGNVFDHNGWYAKAGGSPGAATMFNHNTYIASCQDITLKNNIFMRPSSGGNKFTGQTTKSGIVVDDNLYYDTEIGISMGVNYLSNTGRFESPKITNNVFLKVGYTRPSGGPGWGLWISGWKGGEISNNRFINDDVTYSNAQTFYLYGQNGTSSNPLVISNNKVRAPENAGKMILVRKQNQTPGYVNLSNNDFYISGSITYALYSDVSLSTFNFTNNTYYFSSDVKSYIAGTTATITTSSNSTDDDDIPSASEKNLGTYMSKIGEGSSDDDFIESVRSQQRYDWDSNLTASVINDYFRGVDSTSSGGSTTVTIPEPEGLKVYQVE